ncbi:MAG: hypothetical protein D8M57_00900 [Candidatus Scalindua sp. AMX11]|nr:MAG: hypothetical protein DWQ00_18080 [Candidatus Scalindua sp.]TDE66976.1 MAG: hypothetical protein D8M57_00900 [Candidatus Scalindua sp. AMX11]
MQGYQERYVYFLTNHHKNTVAYIQIPKASLSHPLLYQSRSMQGVISKNYLNFVTILSNITQSQKSNFLSSKSLLEQLVLQLKKLIKTLKLGEQHFFCGISQIAIGSDMLFVKACQAIKDEEIPHRLFLPQHLDQ